MENSGKSFFIVCDILRFFVDIIFYEKKPRGRRENLCYGARKVHKNEQFFLPFHPWLYKRRKKRDGECKKYSWVGKKIITIRTKMARKQKGRKTSRRKYSQSTTFTLIENMNKLREKLTRVVVKRGSINSMTGTFRRCTFVFDFRSVKVLFKGTLKIGGLLFEFKERYLSKPDYLTTK